MELTTTSVAVFGQRPHHTTPDQRAYSTPEMARVIAKLTDLGAARVVSGIGPGPEQEAATHALHHNLGLVAVVPYADEHITGRPWDRRWIAGYGQLLVMADEVLVASENRNLAAFGRRNQLIVDRATMAVVVTNGHNRGGTWDAMRRIVESQLPVVCIDTAYQVTRLFDAPAFAAAFKVPNIAALALGAAA